MGGIWIELVPNGSFTGIGWIEGIEIHRIGSVFLQRKAITGDWEE